MKGHVPPYNCSHTPMSILDTMSGATYLHDIAGIRAEDAIDLFKPLRLPVQISVQELRWKLVGRLTLPPSIKTDLYGWAAPCQACVDLDTSRQPPAATGRGQHVQESGARGR